jgi:hypothetical protein
MPTRIERSVASAGAVCVTLVLRELAWDGGVFPLRPRSRQSRSSAAAVLSPMGPIQCAGPTTGTAIGTAMVILVCGASSADILDALHGALLTDEEVRRPRDWIRYDDPFGDWHEEPCMDRAEVADNAVRRTQQDGDP